MQILNLRDLGGVVHLQRDVLTSYCKDFILSGWAFTRDIVTCIECVSSISAVNTFSRSIAYSLAARTFIRAQKEVSDLAETRYLRPGDSLDFKHDFQVRCIVEINEDGSIDIKDPP